MCGTCGCAGEALVVGQGGGHGHEHAHDDAHSHANVAVGVARTVPLEIDVLAKNDGLATVNREWLARRGIVALNYELAGAGKRRC
jgi:hydrogenase nickel incorporation protein HypB